MKNTMSVENNRPGFDQKMTAEEINSRPIARYTGPVHIVRTAQELERAAHALHRETVLGFDTETKPAFHKGQSNPVSIIQFAGSRAVYIIQAHRVPCLEPLGAILCSSRIIKAGIDLQQDIAKLKSHIACQYNGFVDVNNLAKDAGIKNFSMRGLAAIVLGVRIPKGARTSNWARDTLTPQQIAYAATDAWISRELYLRLGSKT